MPVGLSRSVQAEPPDRRCCRCAQPFSAVLSHPEPQLCVLNCVFFLYSPRSLVSRELHSVAHFPVVGWSRAPWAAPAWLAARAWFAVLVSLALVWFAALALIPAGKAAAGAAF